MVGRKIVNNLIILIIFFFNLDKIPTRFNVAVMLFMATFTAYMLRVNISIAMIPMIKENSTANGNATIDVNIDIFH